VNYYSPTEGPQILLIRLLFSPVAGSGSVEALAGHRKRQAFFTPRMERYTANTHGKTDRVPTMAVLSPDGKFLIVGTTSSSEQPASQQRSTMAGRLDGVSGR